MHTVYIALGSNLGDRTAYIGQALVLFDEAPDIWVQAVSSLIETEPVGGPKQGKFLNGVAEIQTKLSPRQLHARMQAFERKLSRIRTVLWGPRTIDLDILSFSDVVMTTKQLQIPHPRMAKRRFVLQPLQEIAPGWQHPMTGQSINELLAAL